MLPHRSRHYGVGKKIGGAVYLHRNYEHLIGNKLLHAKQFIPNGQDYVVVKYQQQNGIISFIQSPDFDTAPEPEVGNILVIYPSGQVKKLSALADPYIYHHKWLFVAEDYAGFSVEESIHRSLTWMSLTDIDTRRIGRKSYWNSVVLPRLNDMEEKPT